MVVWRRFRPQFCGGQMGLQAASLLLMICTGVLTLHAQNSPDPLSGIWTGEWGPTPKDRNKVLVELKWDGKNVTGSVQGPGKVAGPNSADTSYAINFKKGSFDAKTGTLRLEATAYFQGHPVNYVINGTLQNNLMTGSWKHGDKKGDLKLIR